MLLFMLFCRFFYMSGVSDAQRVQIEQQLNTTAFNPSQSFTRAVNPSASSKSSLSLKEQCVFFNSIPNVEDSTHRKLTKRFSTSTGGPPLSRRNRVIWAYDKPSQHKCLLSSLTGQDIPPKPSTSNQPSSSTATEASSNHPPPSSSIDPPTDIPQPVTLTSQDLVSALSRSGLANIEDKISEQVQNMQTQNPTIFTNYRYQLHQHGFLFLRFINQQKKIFCLNDCHHLQGTFSHQSFIHCSELLTENGYIYSCDCKVYGTLLDEARDLQNCHSISSFSGVKCVHGRLLEELRQNSESIQSDSTESPVLLIHSSENLRKFSVVCNDSVSLVNLSKQPATNRFIVNCTEGFCRAQKGSSRVLHNLNKGILCPHLEVFRAHSELWQDMLEPVAEEDDTGATSGEAEHLAPPLGEAGYIATEVRHTISPFNFNQFIRQ